MKDTPTSWLNSDTLRKNYVFRKTSSLAEDSRNYRRIFNQNNRANITTFKNGQTHILFKATTAEYYSILRKLNCTDRQIFQMTASDINLLYCYICGHNFFNMEIDQQYQV